MPVTRSNSRQPLFPHAATSNVDHEVIVLSSDDEAPPPRKVSRKHAKPRVNGARSRPAADVIDLASEEEIPVRRHRKTPLISKEDAHRKKVVADKPSSQLREGTRRPSNSIPKAVQRAKTPDGELERLRREVEQLTQAKKALLGTLEEQVTCEICTLKMWQPYTLLCGHSFCLACLQDWFQIAQLQHLAVNPQWEANPPALQHYRQVLNGNLAHAMRIGLESQMQKMRVNMGCPKYTCPSCREPVKQSPAEAFALKAIVRTVAQAEGEGSPKKANHHHREGPRADPWVDLFPKWS